MTDIKSKKRNKADIETIAQAMNIYLNGPDTFEEFRDNIYDLAFEKFYNKCTRQNLTKLSEVDFHNIRLRSF